MTRKKKKKKYRKNILIESDHLGKVLPANKKETHHATAISDCQGEFRWLITCLEGKVSIEL